MNEIVEQLTNEWVELMSKEKTIQAFLLMQQRGEFCLTV